MVSNGSDGPDVKRWKCKHCGYHFRQVTREKLPRGNSEGKALHGPGKRRGDDFKGRRLDTLTTTLVNIVEAPARSDEQVEAILAGAEVLAQVKANPL
jgi:hypothetical protein